MPFLRTAWLLMACAGFAHNTVQMGKHAHRSDECQRGGGGDTHIDLNKAAKQTREQE